LLMCWNSGSAVRIGLYSLGEETNNALENQ
jgi:hypothetical protein